MTIKPLTENFDFDSSNIFATLINPSLKNLVDPYDLNRGTVLIEFEGKDVDPYENYDYDDFLRDDLNSINVSVSGGTRLIGRGKDAAGIAILTATEGVNYLNDVTSDVLPLQLQ